MTTLKIRSDETPAVIFQKCVNAEAEYLHRNDPPAYGHPTPQYNHADFKESVKGLKALQEIIRELNP